MTTNDNRYDQWLHDGITLRDSLVLERNDAVAKVNNLNKQIAELDRVLVRTTPASTNEPKMPPTATNGQRKQPKTEGHICCVLAEHGEMTATALSREVSGRFGSKEGYVRSVISIMRQGGRVKARPIDENSTWRGFYYSLPST